MAGGVQIEHRSSRVSEPVVAQHVREVGSQYLVLAAVDRELKQDIRNFVDYVSEVLYNAVGTIQSSNSADRYRCCGRCTGITCIILLILLAQGIGLYLFHYLVNRKIVLLT